MSFERRQKILELLRQKGAVSLKELEKIFTQVSSMTLRRDLEYFETAGEAVRIKGGIRYIKSLPGVGREDLYEQRLSQNQEPKSVIARIAADYICAGRSIFLDSGTTLMALAKSLPDVHLSILTSAPNIALEISKRYAPTVNLIGGLINRETLSVSGMQAMDFVEHLNFDLAVMAPSAFTVDTGFTCGNYSECELKKRIIKKAKQTIMLADSSKFGHTMPFTFSSLGDIDILITETKPSEEILKAALEHNVLVRWE